MTPLNNIPTYEKMRDEAVALYHKEYKEAWCSLLISAFINIGVVLLFIRLNFTFSFLWVLVGICVAALWLPSAVRKIPLAKKNYQFRLQRAVETLTNANIFMQIPDEDWTKFDTHF